LKLTKAYVPGKEYLELCCHFVMSLQCCVSFPHSDNFTHLARLQETVAVQLTPSLFRNVSFVVGYRRFGIAYRSHLPRSSSYSWTTVVLPGLPLERNLLIKGLHQSNTTYLF